MYLTNYHKKLNNLCTNYYVFTFLKNKYFNFTKFWHSTFVVMRLKLRSLKHMETLNKQEN